MTARPTLATLSGLLILAALCGAADGAAQRVTVTVAGEVLNNHGAEPVRDAWVGLFGADSAALDTTRTGPAGRFLLRARLRPGCYRVHAAARGYDAMARTVAISRAGAYDVGALPTALTLFESRLHVLLTCTPARPIGGRAGRGDTTRLRLAGGGDTTRLGPTGELLDARARQLQSSTSVDGGLELQLYEGWTPVRGESPPPERPIVMLRVTTRDPLPEPNLCWALDTVRAAAAFALAIRGRERCSPDEAAQVVWPSWHRPLADLPLGTLDSAATVRVRVGADSTAFVVAKHAGLVTVEALAATSGVPVPAAIPAIPEHGVQVVCAVWPGGLAPCDSLLVALAELPGASPGPSIDSLRRFWPTVPFYPRSGRLSVRSSRREQLLVLGGPGAVDSAAGMLARFTGVKRAWPIEAMTVMTVWDGRRFLCGAGRCEIWSATEVNNGISEPLPGRP
jgi:hypothetical protein